MARRVIVDECPVNDYVAGVPSRLLSKVSLSNHYPQCSPLFVSGEIRVLVPLQGDNTYNQSVFSPSYTRVLKELVSTGLIKTV